MGPDLFVRGYRGRAAANKRRHPVHSVNIFGGSAVCGRGIRVGGEPCAKSKAQFAAPFGRGKQRNG